MKKKSNKNQENKERLDAFKHVAMAAMTTTLEVRFVFLLCSRVIVWHAYCYYDDGKGGGKK